MSEVENDLVQVTNPQNKRGSKRKSARLTISLIIAETRAGKSPKQIAALYGYSQNQVLNICKKHGFSAVALRAYKEHRADLFAFKQSQILEHMTVEKISGASLRDQATTFNILHNAERLERGQSTQNVDFQSMSMQLSELEVEEARLKKELEKLQSTAETVSVTPVDQ